MKFLWFRRGNAGKSALPELPAHQARATPGQVNHAFRNRGENSAYLARKPEGNRPYWNGYSEKYRAEHGFRRPGARAGRKVHGNKYRAHHQHIGNYADQARIKRLSVAVHSGSRKGGRPGRPHVF